jgi:Kef-type K+ transport system membrane component KefB
MSDFLLLALVFLTAGILFVPLASRLGLGSVLGYLIAGIAISPLLSALHVDVVAVQHFAEFGVVMMLFLVGLELEPKRIWQMRNRLLGLGGAQVAGSAALLASGAGCCGTTVPGGVTTDGGYNRKVRVGIVLSPAGSIGLAGCEVIVNGLLSSRFCFTRKSIFLTHTMNFVPP